MTWILGFKRDKCVHLIADSAITYFRAPGSKFWPPKINTTHTLFGQKIIMGDSECVDEGAVKLYKLQDDIAVAAAGDVGIINEFLSCFKTTLRLRQGKDIERCVIDSVRSTEVSGREIELLIAFAQPQIGSQLLAYKKGRLFNVERFEQCGYFDHYGMLPAIFARDAISRYIDEARLECRLELHVLIALFNAFSILENPLKYGVGGHFFGLSILGGSVVWPDLIRVARLDDSGKPHDYVNLSEKKNVVIGISITPAQSVRAYTHPINIGATTQKDLNDLISMADNDMKSTKPRYVIYVNSSQKKITIIDYNKGANPHYDLEIHRIPPNTKFKSRHSTTLKKWFEFPVEPDPTNVLEYSLAIVKETIEKSVKLYAKG